MIAGQAYADTQKVIGTQGILQGFWVEVVSANPTPTQTKPTAQPSALGVQVTFHASEAALLFTVNAEVQATARLLIMDGRQLGATWSQTLHAGTSQFTMPLSQVGTSPVIMVVSAGFLQKTYRFTPNLQK